MPDDKKNPIPVGSSETVNSIPLNSKSLASMAQRGAGYISTVAAMAGHSDGLFMPAGQSQQALAAPVARRPVRMIYAKGENYFDTTKNKKVVIVMLAAGYTKKSHTVCHKVADARGNTWLVKEKDLVRLP